MPRISNLHIMLNNVLIGVFGLGGSEMIIIAGIVLLLFGGKKIPELMKGLGKGVKEFKDASKGEDEPKKDLKQ